jgi:hypothetical protein
MVGSSCWRREAWLFSIGPLRVSHRIAFVMRHQDTVRPFRTASTYATQALLYIV